MKRFLLFVAVTALSTCSPVFAANFVSQAVFNVASSATSKQLRITPMRGKVIAKDDDRNTLQTFVWQANQTQNLTFVSAGVAGYQSITFPLSTVLCAWIQVDQDTRVAVNSESAYMLLPAGFSSDVCFK